MWMEEYQVEFLRHYLDALANRPFVAGMNVGFRRFQDRPERHPRPAPQDGCAFPEVAADEK
jgi:hypothetical protein